MAPQRIVVIGAGPAGLATVRGYRDAGGSGSVTLVGAEDHAPYQRPPLTKEFLRGEMARDELVLEPAGWFAERSVGLRLGTRVERIDAARGTVGLADGANLPADACVLTTGSRPQRLKVPGAEHEDVLEMRVIRDSERLATRASAGVRAIVIGSGFVGCEAAASLAMRGAEVTLMSQESLPQIARLGAQAGRHIVAWLREIGIEPVLGVEVEAIENGTRVRVAGGQQFDADLVVLATGVWPNGELAESAGLVLHKGAVPVDARMRSEAPFLGAAGDVAWAENLCAGRRLRVEHWGDALVQGEVAGRALAGEDAQWSTVPGFWSTIGRRTLKYAAWGDGYDEARLVEHREGGFTIWYAQDGVAVGVLTHERDEDYERGRELVARGKAL